MPYRKGANNTRVSKKKSNLAAALYCGKRGSGLRRTLSYKKIPTFIGIL